MNRYNWFKRTKLLIRAHRAYYKEGKYSIHPYEVIKGAVVTHTEPVVHQMEHEYDIATCTHTYRVTCYAIINVPGVRSDVNQRNLYCKVTEEAKQFTAPGILRSAMIAQFTENTKNH